MRVKELIEVLKDCDQESDVTMWINGDRHIITHVDKDIDNITELMCEYE